MDRHPADQPEGNVTVFFIHGLGGRVDGWKAQLKALKAYGSPRL